jgi:hypothetical protein
MPDSRNRSQTRRAIPPVALGTESMRAGPEADKILYPYIIPFVLICLRTVRCTRTDLARMSKLLAHDNKSHASCLLNLAAASRPASFWPRIIWRFIDCCRVAMRAALPVLMVGRTSKGSIVCRAPDKIFSQLRITRAYIRLLCIPESEHNARMVSLGRLGSYEIRIFEPLAAIPVSALFWIELFDHDAQSSIDSCACRDIEEAVVRFDDFIAR